MHLDIPQISDFKFGTRPADHSASQPVPFFYLIPAQLPVATSATDTSCFNPAQKQISPNLFGGVPINWGILGDTFSAVRNSLLSINIEPAGQQAGERRLSLRQKIIARNQADSSSDASFKRTEKLIKRYSIGHCLVSYCFLDSLSCFIC